MHMHFLSEKGFLGLSNPTPLENAEQTSLAEREESVRTILFPPPRIVVYFYNFVQL